MWYSLVFSNSLNCAQAAPNVLMLHNTEKKWWGQGLISINTQACMNYDQNICQIIETLLMLLIIQL